MSKEPKQEVTKSLILFVFTVEDGSRPLKDLLIVLASVIQTI